MVRFRKHEAEAPRVFSLVQLPQHQLHLVHARYAIQFRRFKEEAVKMKNKIALRNHLKVVTAHTSMAKQKSNQGKAAVSLVGTKRAATRVFHRKSHQKRKRQRAYHNPRGKNRRWRGKGGDRSLTEDD